ncbi:MAG: hypothetical protein H5U40_01810 [Polyangiaceae bacterium]|nr:hypothetical protein [Polyangiaceae bacterium]
MNRKRILALAALLAFCFAVPSGAEAQSRRRGGTPYAERHLTLPKRTLRFDMGPFERGINDAGILLGPYDESAYGLRFQDYNAPDGEDDVHVLLGLGVSYGVFNNLEIGVLVVPLNFEHDQKYGDLTPYVRWAFVDNRNFQMGLQGTVQIPTWTDLGFGVGLPMNFNAGRIVRIEMGVELEVVFDDRDYDRPPDGEDEPRLAIDVPLALSFNIRPRGFLGARADLLWDQIVGDYDAFRPGVGAFGGFSLFGRRATYADFTGSFMGYFKDDIINWEVVLGATVAIGI